jgi:phage-related protein (TIGR01555 family)
MRHRPRVNYEDKYKESELNLERERLINQELQSRRSDSIYQNKITGLGTPQDVSTAARIKPFSIYPFMELEELYAMDPTINKILNTLTLAVFKNDFKIESEDKKYNAKFKKLWTKHKIEEKVRELYTYGNIFGQSFLFPDLDDNKELEKPLNFKKIRSLDSIQVIPRYMIAPEIPERNFLFEPIHYHLIQQPMISYSGESLNNPAGVDRFSQMVRELSMSRIHYTRLPTCWGSKLPPYLYRLNYHFHDTYIRKIENAVKNYHVAIDNISTLISKIPYAISKHENLSNLLLSPEMRSDFAGMMAARERMRSTHNISVMDTREEYELVSPSLSGYSDLINQIKDQLCLEINMPHDVLFGEGSQGTTSGRTEKSNWETFIQSEQKFKIYPIIEFFMKVFQSLDGLEIPHSYEITFEHSETPTPLEDAQALQISAASLESLANQGLDGSQYILNRWLDISQEATFQELDESKEEFLMNQTESDIEKDE